MYPAVRRPSVIATSRPSFVKALPLLSAETKACVAAPPTDCAPCS